MKTKRTNQIRVAGLVLLAGLLAAVTGCTDNFQELNTPDNQLTAEEMDGSLLGQAFAYSQYHGMRGRAAQGFQTGQNLFADLYAQYYATTAAQFDSDQYVEVGGWTNGGAWNYFYQEPAPQLHFVKEFTEEEGMELENAVAKVWHALIYQRQTDYFGPIIYSEFGSGETSVAYDSQEDVYMDLINVLDEATAVLSANLDGNAFGTHDQVFDGNAADWYTLANSLRLRIAMRMAYVEPDLAQEQAEQAINDGVMTDNSENAMLETTDNSMSPYATVTAWGEFRMSATMQSALEGFEDPRMSVYFAPAVDSGEFRGMRNGLSPANKGGDRNTQFSDVSQKYQPLGSGGSNPDLRVMSTAEVYFLRAEGALRGWSMGGVAADLYNEGIAASMRERANASDADIAAYQSSTNTPTALDDEWDTPAMSDIPVLWDPTGDDERNLEQIITQKWIALFPDGIEAWAEFRRTGYPRTLPIISSSNSLLSEDSGGPRRLTFVEGEYSDNASAVDAATGLLNGPDEQTTRLWWDVKDHDRLP